MGPIGSALNWLVTQIGYAICHQMPARTLHYGGRALPVCARDTGLFIGFALTFVALIAVYGKSGGRRPSWKVTAVLAALVLPMVVDAVTSYAGWRETTNFIRLFTGALAGTSAAALVFPLASEQAFGERATAVVPARMRSVPLLLLLPASLTLALATDWPGAFYVWAALLVLSILFTLLVLNYTLVSLVVEQLPLRGRPPARLPLAAIAAAAVVVELVASNRLHWLVDRVL